MERKLKYALALPFKVRDVLQSTTMECFHYKGGAGTRIPTCVAMYMYKRNTFSTGKASSQSNIIKRQLCNTNKIECFLRKRRLVYVTVIISTFYYIYKILSLRYWSIKSTLNVHVLLYVLRDELISSLTPISDPYFLLKLKIFTSST